MQGERAELGGSGVPGDRLQVISTLLRSTAALRLPNLLNLSAAFPSVTSAWELCVVSSAPSQACVFAGSSGSGTTGWQGGPAPRIPSAGG